MIRGRTKTRKPVRIQAMRPERILQAVRRAVEAHRVITAARQAVRQAQTTTVPVIRNP